MSLRIESMTNIPTTSRPGARRDDAARFRGEIEALAAQHRVGSAE